ncbi:OmpA family protein [Hymenobacter sp. BT175]|uniref:OmpA family protein n=1 Tax=Hymenobacter translucens TaxID=2886507 RepID=UPI001D0DD925|nr:OmpA family protein [Hymenobacter translucens]MCC2548277.1 OmpA family protein [Hymenobacter translucens]
MNKLLRVVQQAAALVTVALALPQVATAQTAERRSSIGVNLSALQYQGEISNDYWKFSNSRYAPGVAINQYLGRGIDLNTQLFYGEFTGRRNSRTYFTTTVVNANLGFKLKLNNGWALKEDALIQPYLLVGSGWTYASRAGAFDSARITQEKGYIDLMGAAGFNLRLGPGVGLFVQTGQHLPLNANLDGSPEKQTPNWSDRFLQHQIGLTFNLGQAPDSDEDGVQDRLDMCPSTPPAVPVNERGCPLDSDSDGVPDYQDSCPGEAGKAEFNGCPDADDDGVMDSDDACPNTAGRAELRGCPDADNDNITDEEDQCPDTPAGAEVDAKGCPVKPAAAPAAPAAPAVPSTDTDNDGVANDVDRCPSSAGPASNKGCPEVKPETWQRLHEATKFISFELNKATLLPSSFATLDDIVQILTDYPDYTLSIAGHTDSKGPAAYNLRLSRERAAAARTYMLSKGVAENRIELRGYGARHPIASNTAEAGRAQNRRVEFNLFLTGDPNAAQVKYGREPVLPTTVPARRAKAAPARKPTIRRAPVRKAAPKKVARPAAPAKAKAAVRPATPTPKTAVKKPVPAPPRR